MKELTFKKIDAFATANSSGNPAGYVSLGPDDELSEAEMLRVAKELKGFVSEVGFARPGPGKGYRLVYYSSEREVDFCGHATVAIMHDLFSLNEELRSLDSTRIFTKRGELVALNRIESEDAVFIQSPEPVEKTQVPALDDIAASLGADRGILRRDASISIINAGLSTLLVPIKDLPSILALSPDMATLKGFCLRSGIDIVEVFTSEVASSSNRYRTRVFAPLFGYLEDPATGSGNSAFGYYLMRNRMWEDRETISIEQNGSLDAFNVVKLRKGSAGEKGDRVYFGGRGLTRIEGQYLLQ